MAQLNERRDGSSQPSAESCRWLEQVHLFHLDLGGVPAFSIARMINPKGTSKGHDLFPDFSRCLTPELVLFLKGNQKEQQTHGGDPIIRKDTHIPTIQMGLPGFDARNPADFAGTSVLCPANSKFEGRALARRDAAFRLGLKQGPSKDA